MTHPPRSTAAATERRSQLIAKGRGRGDVACRWTRTGHQLAVDDLRHEMVSHGEEIRICSGPSHGKSRRRFELFERHVPSHGRSRARTAATKALKSPCN